MAFTLIELVVVIAIIAILAGLVLTGAHSGARTAQLKLVKTELAEIKAGIDAYYAKYRFYPPDNPVNPILNPLYFELSGTTNGPANGGTIYRTLDGSSQLVSPADFTTLFGPASGIKGFANSSAGGRGDDAAGAVSFLQNLRPAQIGQLTLNGTPINALLVCSIEWPDNQPAALASPPASRTGLAPWRYVSTRPMHNSGSYDLWVDVYIGGKTYRVNNWGQPEIY